MSHLYSSVGMTFTTDDQAESRLRLRDTRQHGHIQILNWGVRNQGMGPRLTYETKRGDMVQGEERPKMPDDYGKQK
uniref:Uncharacterized protein n=1 Tax=Magallana gigas TaxID=29159 RepID=K1QZ22_MAGGI